MTHLNPEETKLPVPHPLRIEHDPCALFAETFGVAAREDIKDALELIGTSPEEAEALAYSAAVSATESLPWKDRQGPIPSQAARIALRCMDCVLTDVCPIDVQLSNFAERQEALQKRQEDEGVFDAVLGGPKWLLIHGLHQNNLTTKKLREVVTAAVQSNNRTGILQDAGIDIASLHAGITYRKIANLAQGDFPSVLQHALTAVRNNKSFETHTVDFNDGALRTIAVTDLTPVNGFNGVMPSEQEYGILIAKLVEAMRGVDANGQLPNLNLRMVNIIRNFEGGGKVLEMRMGGKNRMYSVFFSIFSETDENGLPMYRMVIIGAHGGNADTQKDFLSATGISNLPRT